MIERITSGYFDAPFSILGTHEVDNKFSIHAFYPYAFKNSLFPHVVSLKVYFPSIKGSLGKRLSADNTRLPVSIYKVHLGSWSRHVDSHSWLNYRELAEQLIPYVKDMGFTHIELLPISKSPFDGSWGCQPIGLYSPTSRFGSIDDFIYSIDIVIVNLIPAIRENYRTGIQYRGEYSEIINIDSQYYRGSNVGNMANIHTELVACHNKSHSISVVIPPLATLFLKKKVNNAKY